MNPGRTPGRVYPRVCGGTTFLSILLLLLCGLSPRVRGNPRLTTSSSRYSRSIPACAGNRTRCDGGGARRGSIPACAGEPGRGRAARTRKKVYPRVCGGTGSIWECRGIRKGLSPRVRGNHGRYLGCANGVGSIPACAGEPHSPVPPYRRVMVYPRVCGGTGRGPSRRSEEKGLSPRVRGNLDVLDVLEARVRSIPACAGEPPGSRRVRAVDRVYPRVCGGTKAGAYDIPPDRGLSPRVRGTIGIRTMTVRLSGLSPRVRGNPRLRTVE